MISIVVPVYNVLPYLSDCINSIVTQRDDGLEIILVDDGSTDGSERLCDQYAKEYEMVRVIHKKNTGLSATRNLGIEVAKGEYIIFVDSDDMLAPGFVSKALELAELYHADLIAFSYRRCKADAKWTVEYQYVGMPIINVWSERVQKMQKFLIGSEIGTMACAKMYRRELFETVRYPVGKYHEDVFTTYKLVDKSCRIVTTSQVGYFYRKSPNSITTNAFSEKRLECIEGKREQLAFIQENYPGLQKEGEVGVIYACNQCLMLMAKARYKNKPVIDELQKTYRKYGKSYLISCVSMKGKVLTCIAIINIRLAYALCTIGV